MGFLCWVQDREQVGESVQGHVSACRGASLRAGEALGGSSLLFHSLAGAVGSHFWEGSSWNESAA